VAFRLDPEQSAIFDAAVAEAAKDAPAGVDFTASDYLRGLFLTDAKARGLLEQRKDVTAAPNPVRKSAKR